MPYKRKLLVFYHTSEKINIPSIYFGFKVVFFYIDYYLFSGSFSAIRPNFTTDRHSNFGLGSVLIKIIRHYFPFSTNIYTLNFLHYL